MHTDLDTAFGIDFTGSQPQLMINAEMVDEGKSQQKDGYDVVKHGDFANGRLMGASGAERIDVHKDIVWGYTSNHFIMSGTLHDVFCSFDLPGRWWRQR
ncbi:MAG: hypothetical protein GY847_39295 [Proteobacteria bacterium]|nr:hypothetical protein [Pseudomonadota bacterium]